MSVRNFKVGDRVRFYGLTTAEGKFYGTGPSAKDIYTATITSIVHGVCYSLTLDNGKPAGLPFFDHQLTLEG